MKKFRSMYALTVLQLIASECTVRRGIYAKPCATKPVWYERILSYTFSILLCTQTRALAITNMMRQPSLACLLICIDLGCETSRSHRAAQAAALSVVRAQRRRAWQLRLHTTLSTSLHAFNNHRTSKVRESRAYRLLVYLRSKDRGHVT